MGGRRQADLMATPQTISPVDASDVPQSLAVHSAVQVKKGRKHRTLCMTPGGKPVKGEK
jgi:hypothetical protein